MNASIRVPAVAGMFYPADRHLLHRQINDLLAEAPASPPDHTMGCPKALIVPHAGYIYSGPVAATAYALIAARHNISRVVLLGPTHRVYIKGLALPDHATRWQTPLGDVPIDTLAAAGLATCPHVILSDAAHAAEHSLEVQLPFLQEVLGTFTLVPLAVGDADPADIAQVLDALWGGPETLIVISSDLSHFESYDRAVAMDKATTDAILALDISHLPPDCACGRLPMAGLLHIARERKLRPERLDLRNSGDTAGPRDQVVGYAAFAFYEEPTTS